MDKVQTLVKFWNSFDIPAYDENSVPDKAEPPYITFNVVTDNLGHVVNLYGNIWYKSASWRDAERKALQIAKYIGYGHRTMKVDEGILYITRGTPFSQRMADTDDRIKRIYINLQVEYLTEY